ncbi:hypothetical protein I4U23_001762 [Adineta vaga]|nr:hypothetical protein I4U23_001762 [Adineta vaga]
MQLESLPNELLLDLFLYFNGVHLICAFHKLNSRFDKLVFLHFQSNNLNFQSGSKTDLDIVFQQHLPFLTNRITSLYLSDTCKNIRQTICLRANNLTVNRFIHLQTLRLFRIFFSFKIMDRTIYRLDRLSCLIHLEITACRFKSSYFHKIWYIPYLKRCILNNRIKFDQLKTPTEISYSLEYLALTLPRGHPLPSLSHEATSSMEVLNLTLRDVTYGLTRFLENMSNLCKLTITTEERIIDGLDWEESIADYLPKLKILRFLMEFILEGDESNEKHIDQILDTFRSRFWLHDRRWFVRCH